MATSEITGRRNESRRNRASSEKREEGAYHRILTENPPPFSSGRETGGKREGPLIQSETVEGYTADVPPGSGIHEAHSS